MKGNTPFTTAPFSVKPIVRTIELLKKTIFDRELKKYL
jgi:hypothetical protein